MINHALLREKVVGTGWTKVRMAELHKPEDPNHTPLHEIRRVSDELPQ